MDDNTLTDSNGSMDDEARTAITEAATFAALDALKASPAMANGALTLLVVEALAHAMGAAVTAALEEWMMTYYELVEDYGDLAADMEA